MRIRLLTSAGPWSGAEVHTVGLAEVLSAAGHDVAIVEIGRNRYSRAPRPVSTKVIHVALGEPGTAEAPLGTSGGLESYRAFRGLAADVGILVKGHFDLGSWRIDLAARLGFHRYVTIEHMNWPLPERQAGRHLGGVLPGLGLWWYRKKLAGWARSIGPQNVVCVSHAVRSTLARDYGFPSKKLVTIHNGVDATIFRPDPALRRSARKAWGVPADALLFGAVGRLSPMKGYETAIEHFSTLRRAFPRRDMRLILVGDGPLRDELRALARAKGLLDFVLFPGFSDRPHEVYPAFDVFVLPSHGEALGIALIEAMACGCPPIAASVGGVPEVVTDPTLGWLVPSGSAGGFFDAMTAAAERTGDELALMGRRARDHVIAHFDAGTQFSSIARLIEETAGAADRP